MARTPCASSARGRIKKGLQQGWIGLAAHDPRRIGPLNDLVLDGERPGCGVPDVAGRAWEARIEHQDTEGLSIDGSATP
jgi:hypothetical protein